MQFLKSNNFKPTKKVLKIANEILVNNGGIQKFNDTIASRNLKDKEVKPRPPPQIPPCASKFVPANVSACAPSDVSSYAHSSTSSSIPPPPKFDQDLINNPNKSPIVPNSAPSEKKNPSKGEQMEKPSFLEAIKQFNPDKLKSAKPGPGNEIKNIGEPDIVDQLLAKLKEMRKYISM